MLTACSVRSLTQSFVQGGALGAALHEEIAALSAKAKLAGYETVRAAHVESRLFSVDDELLTPTFKLKRHAVQTKFQPQIDELYKRPVPKLPIAGRPKL